MRTTLGNIDLALGRSHRANDALVDELHTLVVKLRRLQEVHDRAHVHALLDEVSTLEKSLRERAMERDTRPPVDGTERPSEAPERRSQTGRPAPPKKKTRPSLLAHLGLGLVPNRPLRELPIWRLLGLCVVFAAASLTMLLSARGSRSRRR
ncbi:hypothetical protein [Pendulispora albinea]|uniref:Uncharacterized protein n=1 Tax=Pendulispora albinea TaxID=2741071 RepID=A0ABZ2LWM5_9BACT